MKWYHDWITAYSLSALVRRKNPEDCARDEQGLDDTVVTDNSISLAATPPIHASPDESTNILSPVPEKPAQQLRLKRELRLIDVLAYGVATTVGAGIYSVIGSASATAGPAIAFSFLVGAATGLFTGLAYSEFATRVPVAGSAYTYSYATFGELVAFSYVLL